LKWLPTHFGVDGDSMCLGVDQGRVECRDFVNTVMHIKADFILSRRAVLGGDSNGCL